MKGLEMLKSIKMAALAAAVSVTSMSYAPASFAQDVEFLIGPNGVRIRTADFCQRNPYDQRCRPYFDRHGRDYPGRPQGNYRKPREGRYGMRCDESDAISKARSMGVRRADVVRSNSRYVVVQGFSRGDRVRLTFGRDGNCSILR
ncbi:MAG: hypothetical protein QM744_02690 [Mesorhizobium sp.]